MRAYGEVGSRSRCQTSFAAVAMLSFGLGCGAEAQELSGDFMVATPTGPAPLSLVAGADGTVHGILLEPGVGDHSLSGEMDDGEITGALMSPQRQGEFEVYFDEDAGHLFFVFTPRDETGELRGDAEVEWPMVAGHGPSAEIALAALTGASVDAAEAAGSGIDSDLPSSGVVEQGQADVGLVGLWRTTVVINSDVGSVVQDLFLEFRPDGSMAQRTGGTIGSTPDGSITIRGGESEEGLWRTQANRLEASIQGSPWVAFATFYIEGTSLLLTYYDNSRQVWTRL